jgi:uncharacterized protein YbjT (DUF2867 family)
MAHLQVKSLLLTGASGFLGGSVLSSILASTSTAVKGLRISALVRSKTQGEWLITQGVEPIYFKDFSDTEHLRKAASEHDGEFTGNTSQDEHRVTKFVGQWW